MEPTKKNKPNNLVKILFALIILMIIIYFILVMFFPTVFEHMSTGDIQPVPNK
ncbi:t-SNARE complex subunit (syntaxin) [Chryseobacterium sp. W4I1]|nr:t-SNARE complex subunit (syntaxin) [Chryseobacterium sp. W4I1]